MLFDEFLRKIYRKVRAVLLHRLIPCSKKPFQINNDTVIEVFGFFESYSGIGESARLCANALKAYGYQVKCVSVESMFRKKSQFQWVFENSKNKAPATIRIFHLNPPMLPIAIFSIGFKKFMSSYNIGYWAWELEDIPEEWKRAIRYINAIFTPSNFSAQAIKQYTQKNVITVLHPVTVDKIANNDLIRDKLNISNEAFLVSSIFSFGSALERKNPQALIYAFHEAFQHNEQAFLVLKSNSGSLEEKQQIVNLIAGNKNIVLVDEHWSRKDILGLIKTSNIYASLHRSEGFGLTIAEALLLDVPVMVTNWSGNTDFCNKESCYLINYNLIPVKSNHPEFKELSSLRWADADVKHASSVLFDMHCELIKNKKIKSVNTSKFLKARFNEHSYSNALSNLEKSTKH